MAGGLAGKVSALIANPDGTYMGVIKVSVPGADPYRFSSEDVQSGGPLRQGQAVIFVDQVSGGEKFARQIQGQ